MPIQPGILAMAGASTSAYELIGTISASNTGSYVWDNIPQMYRHLQIRYSIRQSSKFNLLYGYMNDLIEQDYYSSHALHAFVPNILSFRRNDNLSLYLGLVSDVEINGLSFSHGIVDIFDYSNTQKFKTTKSISGYNDGSLANSMLYTSSFRSLSPVTKLDIRVTGSYISGSQMSLYGIR